MKHKEVPELVEWRGGAVPVGSRIIAASMAMLLMLFANTAAVQGAEDPPDVRSIAEELRNTEGPKRIAALTAVSEAYLAVRFASLEIVKMTLDDKDRTVREQAFAVAMLIGPADTEETVDLLLSQLTSPSLWKRACSVRLLGRLGRAASKAAGPLSSALGNDAEIEQAIVETLGRIGSPAFLATPKLRAIAANKSKPSGLRGEASLALGRIGDLPSVGLLLEATASKGVPLKIGAARGLGELRANSDKVLNRLAVLTTDPNPGVRNTAAWALGHVGEPSKLVINGLLGLLDDEIGPVRRTAIRALRSLQPTEPEIVPPLLKFAGREAATVNRIDAMACLVQIGKPGIVHLDRCLLKDPGDSQKAAAEALGRIAGGWERLVIAAGHDDPGVRLAACFGMRFVAKRDAPRCEAALLAVARDQFTRASAMFAIEELRLYSDRVVDLMREFLSSPAKDRFAVARAFEILGGVANKSGAARKALEEASRSADRGVSAVAKSVLDRLRGKEAGRQGNLVTPVPPENSIRPVK